LCGAGAAEALAEFRAAVTDDVWSDGGLGTVTSHVAVLREGSRIAAMCGYRPWSETVGDPCILVHPESSGRGFGTAVASAAVAAALSDGKTVLYQTLDANAGSLAIARKLGFRRFASYLAVRLREGAD
jgi:GNAT superfamily N-acetyltransferase